MDQPNILSNIVSSHTNQLQMFSKPESSLEKLDKLLIAFGSPLYIYNEQMIRNNAREFMNAFKSYIPNFKQYFAVKATPNKYVMQILQDEGMGFDCSSLSEVELVGQLKCPSEIMYTSNYTSVDDFESVLCSIHEGIINCRHDTFPDIIINLDDTDGLDNLCNAAKFTKLNLPEMISFRVNPAYGGTDSETSSNILGGRDTKFGIPDDKIVNAYRQAIDAGFTKFGIHVMAGSCVLDLKYFEELVNVVFNIINNIHKELNITFEIINFGGGIGIAYTPDQQDLNIDEVARTIAVAIKKINKNIQLRMIQLSLWKMDDILLDILDGLFQNANQLNVDMAIKLFTD